MASGFIRLIVKFSNNWKSIEWYFKDMEVPINAVTPGVGDYCIRVSHSATQRRSSLRKSRSESPGDTPLSIFRELF
jgi:hypothetical protein